MKYNKYIPKRGIVTVQEIALRNSKDGFIPINISRPSLKEVIIPPIVGECYSYNKDGDIKEGDRLLEIHSSFFISDKFYKVVNLKYLWYGYTRICSKRI